MTDVVTLTDTATEQITSEMEADGDHLLRVRVAGGGCSGLSYELFWEMTEFVKETDTIIDYPSFKVLVDQKSLIYLKGMELDYDGGLQGKGFKFRNPNALHTCGCGESFSVV